MFSFNRSWSRPKTGRLRNPGCCCCFFVLLFMLLFLLFLLMLFCYFCCFCCGCWCFCCYCFFIVVVVCNPEDCCCGQVLNSGSQLAVSRPAPEPPLTTQRNGSQVPTHTLHNLAGGFSLLDLKRIFFCPLGPFENYIIR